MTRKIILGDRVIGGLPPQPPEPPALPAEHPHVVGSYRALCECGHTGQLHRGNPGDTRCLYEEGDISCACMTYRRRPFEPVPIGVQGTSVQPVMFTAPAWLETSACEHANEVPATCPCPPYCPCQFDNGPCAHPAVPNSPAPSVLPARPFSAASAAYQWALLMGYGPQFEERANRPDYGYCQCGHTSRQHSLDRTGNSPEPCVLCECGQFRSAV